MRSLYIISLMSLLLLGACNKFVETAMPADQLPSESVFQNNRLLTASLNGVYGKIGNSIISWVTLPPYFADEILNPNASSDALDAQENTYTPESLFTFWAYYYTAIYNANAILEGIEKPAASLSADTVRQVKGEALFLRAYCYFYLVNYYGDVPLVKTTEALSAALLPRTSTVDVYKSIIADLVTASGLLNETYPTPYRWRVNKHAVNALLSKVYLYTKDWVNAEAAATSVISSPLYSLPTDLNSIFLAASNETIWQLWTQNGYNQGITNFVPSNTAAVSIRARQELLQAFEPGDQRKNLWLKAGTGASATFYYPYKYKLRAAATGNNAEYNIQLRLADIYLVRAEARAQRNNLDGGNKDLYEVRKRAGLLQMPAYSTPETLVNAVLAERRRELMFENAERWFDLKRSGQGAAVLSAIKTGFQERALLLPIANTLLASNPNLKQNKDY